jgi:Family of unknown function (DUF6328)
MAEDIGIEDQLKLALDETRMSIMGVQILIGFQLDAVVHEGFAALPASSRACVGVALVLMALAAGVLIAPAAQHRLVEQGEATARIIALTRRLVGIALFLFAVGFALDMYVAMERLAGVWALGFAAATFIAALLFWYGSAGLCRAGKGRAMSESHEGTPMHRKLDYMLTEARVILPGVQALLGFQLIAVLTKPFAELPEPFKIVHAAGLVMLAVAIVLLLAPAALHRLAFAGEDAVAVHKLGSILVTAASVPLALAIAGEVAVAIGVIAGRLAIGAAVAAVVLIVLAALWYAWPLAIRARRQRNGQAACSTSPQRGEVVRRS